MDIHLYVDDERTMPDMFTHIVKTSKEAIAFLETHRDEIITISLDHDLGYDYVSLPEEEAEEAMRLGLAADTSRPIVQWMIDNDFWPLQVFVHSANPIGASWLMMKIRDHAPAELFPYYEIVNDKTYRS